MIVRVTVALEGWSHLLPDLYKSQKVKNRFT